MGKNTKYKNTISFRLLGQYIYIEGTIVVMSYRFRIQLFRLPTLLPPPCFFTLSLRSLVRSHSFKFFHSSTSKLSCYSSLFSYSSLSLLSSLPLILVSSVTFLVLSCHSFASSAILSLHFHLSPVALCLFYTLTNLVQRAHTTTNLMHSSLIYFSKTSRRCFKNIILNAFETMS